MRRRLVWLTTLALCGMPRGDALGFEVVLWPRHALASDGQRAHRLRLLLLEGDRLADGVPVVRAARGAVIGAARATNGGVEITYRPPAVAAPGDDALEVALGGKSVRVPVALEPLGRREVEVRVEPDLLLLEPGAAAQVQVTVRDALGRPAPAPLRLGASVGRLSRLEATGPGRWRALYEPPAERFPQVAILGAASILDGAVGAAALRLAARVPLEGRGEPGSQLRVVIDGKTFGPVRIGDDGSFRVPVVVPPGARAIGLSTDAVGNERRREIDLGLPAFARLLLAVVPPELPADGSSEAEVVAWTIDARGRPVAGRAPPLVAPRGRLGPPRAAGTGAWSWRYTVPAGVGDGAVELSAGPARARLALRPAPPFRIEPDGAPPPLAAGSDAPVVVAVRVVDAGGSPVSGARLDAALPGGRVASVSETAPGRYAVALVAPRAAGRGKTTLHLELAGLRPGAPRHLGLHARRAGDGELVAEAWLDDDLGWPVPGEQIRFVTPEGPRSIETDRYGVARLALPAGSELRVTAEPAGLPGVVAALDVRRLATGFVAAGSLVGEGLAGPSAAPPGASLELPLVVRPHVPVDLRLFPEGVARAGKPLTIRVTTSAAAPGELLVEASRGSAEWQPKPPGGSIVYVPPADARRGDHVVVSATDPRTRVSALVELEIH